ncbi:MAG: hypothetical protein IJJ19_07980 [Erysipelotrichaceae bacterium]|nr:hypothetical protein [Erysipelotrichaceae bacterium]
MKKLVKIALLSLVTVALLAGCTDATATVSDKNKTIIKVGNTTVTKGDIYNEMMKDDAGNTIVNLAMKQIANDEIETTADIQSEAQKIYDDYKAQIEATGVDFEEGLKTYGYTSPEDFMDYCVSTVKSQKLIDKYIEDNFDKLVDEYRPVKAKMIYLDGTSGIEAAAEKGKQAIEEIKAGKSFEEVAEQYSDRKTSAEETLYLLANNSTLDYNVLQFLSTSTTPTLSDLIQANSGNAYYIVQITNTNIQQMRDDFISELKDQEKTSETVYYNYFKDHKFTVYDIDVYNTIKENYPTYLVQDVKD